MGAAAQGLARLRAAAESGELDALCERHHLRVVTVFGSAARGAPGARDLDIGVVTGREEGLDLVALVNELVDVIGIDVVDVAHLDRAGPVLRERALVGCIPLYESSDGQYATAQVAAMAERIETDPGRRQDLELLSR